MKFLILFSLLLIISCKQDPYPGGGELVVEGRGEARTIRESHSLTSDKVLLFNEGSLKKIKIVAAVQKPGEPIIVVENLPEGATYNPVTSELRWKPNFNDADNKNNPTATSKDYEVVFEVASSVDTNEDKTRFDIILRVEDSPQPIIVTRDDNDEVFEGRTLVTKFTIENFDFPQGPFDVSLNDFPVNTKLNKITETEYEIVYSPDYEAVSLLVNTKGVKEYKGIVEVVNPRLRVMTKEFAIDVNDVRLYPNLVPPRKVTQGLDVSLQVVAYDPNKEVAPNIELTSNRPEYGDFAFDLVKSPDSFSSMLNISWTNIPPIHNGKTILLEYQSCVLSRSALYKQCQKEKSKIEIVLRDRNAPEINRSSWKVDKLVYLGFDEEYRRPVKVYDAEDRSLTPKVEIFPKEVRSFITWKNGEIIVKGVAKKAGIFQFNLVATSDYKVSSSESFLIEVFPENRKKVLFFADSTRDPEALFYRKKFDAQMMNPSIQNVSKRNISDRETLIITTSTLLDRSSSEAIMRAIESIPNIVVASPLIDQLPSRFLSDLRDNYDLDVIGRFSAISTIPLEQMSFAAVSQFKVSSGKIGLFGKASIESIDPMIFNGGLYDREKICKGVLGLTPDGNNPLVVGVVCERQGKLKGRISLMGTEWADFKTSENDAFIPESWFNTMITGTF